MKFGKRLVYCLVGMVLLWSLTGMGSEKRLKGHYTLDSGIFDQIKGETPCRVDSASGFVVEFFKEVENPLFESKLKNQVHLMLWFEGEPDLGKRYYIPGDGFQGLCYREKGDLLMFETFTGSGWIEFDPAMKKERLTGKIDLNLVEPHQNFSNSDFHHLGGAFQLEKQ